MRLLSHKQNLVFTRDAGGVDPPELPDGFRFRHVDADTIVVFFGSNRDAWRRKVYRRFLVDDCVGFLVTKGDAWAAIAWLAPPESKQPNHLPHAVSQDHWWALYDHTKQAFRGLGLQKVLVQQRLNWLARNASPGAPIATDINPSNEPSIRAYLRHGFEPAGIVTSKTTRLVPGVAWGSWHREAQHPKNY